MDTGRPLSSFNRARSESRRLLAGALACLLPGLALSFLTLPLMQNLTLMAWVWSLTGWALGRGTRAAGPAAASRRSSSTCA